ncbi:MAG: GNAT family N-acetyltransferase [Rhodothermales bacterium]
MNLPDMTPSLLEADDAEDALALSTAQGWNQTLADWRRLLDLEPAGCFAARRGSRLIGTVTTTTYGDDLAWIGMMIVHADARRQGIGRALMRQALTYLERRGVRTVMLDATPAGRPLYASLGFVRESDVERWEGSPRGTWDVRDRAEEPLAGVYPLDRAAYGADRSRLLERLAAEAACRPVVWRADAGSPAGYALAREGRVATYIGPVVGDTDRIALQLVDEMLARFAGQPVLIDIDPADPERPRRLAERGLTLQRRFIRMRLGRASDVDPGRATGGSIGANAGPEYG